jgi:hypothetical protein
VNVANVTITPCPEAAAPTTAQQWDQLWLPLWPLASDDLVQGVYRMARGDALQRRYIETNPKAFSNLLVVDIDQPDAALRALSSVGSHPMPNAIVENPTNGHAHAVWALTEPVTRTEYARRKPLAYATAITEGLRRAVDGDAAYSGLLTKNPLHASWNVQWLSSDLRTLSELESSLQAHMPPPRWRETSKRRGDIAGLGRNCALFESARHWAYREVRHHFGNPHSLHTAIHTGVTTRNHDFPQPLPTSETTAIANSIWRWITTQSRIWHDGPTTYEATFTTIQAARGQKSAAKRRTARTESLLEVLR